MKEYIHKIRQIFMSTRVIENRLKYQILCCGCMVIHTVFSILTFIGNIHPLCMLNILTVIFYAFLTFVLAPMEKYRAIFILAFIEIEANVTISSILLGSGYEFMVYTLSLIPGAFYLAHTWPNSSKNKYGISHIPLVATLTVGMMYIVVDVLQSVSSPVFAGEEILRMKPIFHYFNILLSVILLLTFSILFALEVRYINKQLNDENTRLGEIASKDPLTRALNRRSLYNIINDEVEKEEHPKFGLIILDIDDFKKVNDTYGHVVGDKVLVNTANVIRESLREGDCFCRWGGEEFLVMVHGEDDIYEIVAERIREGIGKQKFNTEKGEFGVTATFGISTYQTGIQIRTLIDMADQKMYFGKKHGKNQVVK